MSATRRAFVKHMALFGAGIGVLGAAACQPSAPAAPQPTTAAAPTAAPPAATPATAPTQAPAQAAPAQKPAPAAAGTKVLTFAQPEDPASLDVFSNTTVAWQNVTAATIEQLVYFDADKPTFSPHLATSWSNVDPKTVELKLRDGIKFTNGEAFDAQAAKYSLDLLLAAKPYSTFVSAIDSVEAVDPATIRVHMKRPSGMALPALARGSYMYPPKYHQEVGAAKFGTAPIGTGPYVFDTWDKGSRVTLKPNPSYWGGKPTYDQIIWRVIPEESARVAALQAGEVQLITTLSTASVGRIKSDPNLKVIDRPGLRQFASFFEMLQEGPIQNKQVRQALNYAVDKDALVKLFGGEATVLQGQWVTPGVPGFNPNVKAYPYDPAKAKQLLAQAGYPNGFETSMSYTIDRYPLDKEMGQAVAGYLEAVGLKVKQLPLEYATFREKAQSPGKSDPIFQWGLLTPPDPEMTLGLFQKGATYRHFQDGGKIDELLDAGASEPDPQKRAAIYQQVVEYWYDDPLGIYLIVTNDIYGASGPMAGFKPRQDQLVLLLDTAVAK